MPLAEGLTADGWLIGAASAYAVTSGTPVQTGTWQPGDTDAASGTVRGLGLGRQLEAALQQAGQAAQQVASGMAIAAARALVTAQQAGQAAADAGRAVLAALRDAAHAAASALGQLVQAIGNAAICWYRDQRVGWIEWVTDPTSKICAACAENEEAGPVPAGTPFPSGDENTPAHDRCRCATFPSAAPRTNG